MRLRMTPFIRRRGVTGNLCAPFALQHKQIILDIDQLTYKARGQRGALHTA